MKVKKISDISTQPKGIDGIRILVEHHKELENSLLSLLNHFKQIQLVLGYVQVGIIVLLLMKAKKNFVST